MLDLQTLKINYDVEGWQRIAEREGNHCIIPLGAVYAIRSLIAEVEKLREALEQAEMDIQALFFALNKKDEHMAVTAVNRIRSALGTEQAKGE